MSRVEKFGKSRKKTQHDGGEITSVRTNASISNHQALPPRSRKHPSASQKLTRLYYNLLFVLFVCLVAGLFWYGINFSE